MDALETRMMMDATPIPGLSDEFTDSASISQWQRIHEVEGWNADQLNIYDVNSTQPGRMVQQPHTTVWYANWRGPLAFKEVTGDFVFTSEIHITDRDDIGGSDADDIPADGQFSLAGIMIRTPRPITDPANDWIPGSMSDDGTNNGENYAFLSLGYGNGGNEFSLEVKTTRNSNSQLELTSLGQTANTATVQIARIGSSIITLYRLPGEDWQVHRRYSRPDMPSTLQAGLVSYTDWGKASDFDPFTQNSTVLTPDVMPNPTPGEPFNPDLTAGFEYARYASPDVPPALVGADLVNPAAVTDMELLSFLGDNANLEPTPDDSPLVAVHFEVLDSTGEPASELQVGQEFTLQVAIDDLRSDGTGVFSAFLDVTYDGLLANPNGELNFGESYPNAQEGDTSIAGLIDEVGGIASTEELGGDPRILFSLPMVATAAGQLSFNGDAAELLPEREWTLYGLDMEVPDSRIVFNSISLTVVPATAAVDDAFTVFNDGQPIPLDVLANDVDDPAVADDLTIISVSAAAGGLATINADGSQIVFTPTAGFYGDSVFTYTIQDEHGYESSATVTVDIEKRWHNLVLATDVNDDNRTSPMDALIVINTLIRFGAIPLPAVPSPAMANLGYVDVNADGMLSPTDALVVINELIFQAFQRGNGEGESQGDVNGDVFIDDITAPSTPELVVQSPKQPPMPDVDFILPPETTSYAVASKRVEAVDDLFGSNDFEQFLADECLGLLVK